MKKINLIGLAVVVISSLVLLGSAYAETLTVPTQYPTIQAAIDAAENGDMVLVEPGTYIENINFNGKEILVGSLFVTTNNPTYIDSTVIDGNQDGSVVTFNHSEGAGSILKGFAITNGFAANGGGIYCYNSSNPAIKDVTILGNTSSYRGGGIYCGYSSPTLENVTISGNTAGWGGGGVGCVFSSPILENVTISGNTAEYWGGGIHCYYSSPILENVTISGNTSHAGGGIDYSYDSSSTLENVTISGNTAGWGGGIYCDGASPILENVTISGNTASNIGGGIEFCEDSSILRNVTISGNTAGMYGGGIFYLASSNSTLENVIISGNTANMQGGGIDFCVNANPVLRNVTISGNTAPIGGGIYCEFSSDPILENSILWDNSPYQVILNGGSTLTATYSDVEGGWTGVGNINEDPLFIDPENSDYHLQINSPCIDYGNPDPIYNDPEDPANPGMALYPAQGTVRNDMGTYGGPGAQVSITITYPQNGTIIETYTPTVTWDTDGINTNENLRLVISHTPPGSSTPKMSLKSGYQGFFAKVFDFLSGELAYAADYGAQTHSFITIDLEVIVPNTGSYTVPAGILSMGISYQLKLYQQTVPSIYDTVYFSVTQELIPVPPK